MPLFIDLSVPHQNEVAVRKFVPSTGVLLTGNYKNIKIKILKGKYIIYFKKSFSKNLVPKYIQID